MSLPALPLTAHRRTVTSTESVAAALRTTTQVRPAAMPRTATRPSAALTRATDGARDANVSPAEPSRPVAPTNAARKPARSPGAERQPVEGGEDRAVALRRVGARSVRVGGARRDGERERGGDREWTREESAHGELRRLRGRERAARPTPQDIERTRAGQSEPVSAPPGHPVPVLAQSRTER